MIDLSKFYEKMIEFPDRYMKGFDGFWRWKLQVESTNAHILDPEYLSRTANKLARILRGWQTYRLPGGLNHNWQNTLVESLKNIEEVYNEIRAFSLIEFHNVSENTLEAIWNELGRVKEPEGKCNQGGWYYIIAICKPLMLLWGQTLAFDSRVRKNLPSNLKYLSRRWNFKKWIEVMGQISKRLQDSPKVVSYLDQVAKEKYGTTSTVPYGRFLDIYYF